VPSLMGESISSAGSRPGLGEISYINTNGVGPRRSTRNQNPVYK
jgi:hypothetical protein